VEARWVSSVRPPGAGVQAYLSALQRWGGNLSLQMAWACAACQRRQTRRGAGFRAATTCTRTARRPAQPGSTQAELGRAKPPAAARQP